MHRPTLSPTLEPAAAIDASNPLARPCPSCGANDLHSFHRVAQVPTNSCILLPTRAEALAYPRGDIDLAYCDTCGFVANVAFDPALTEYSGRYEETQGFSPTFCAFHAELARALTARHHLHGKDILEIGCGKGEFLGLLCEQGANRGLGFDPGYREDRDRPVGERRYTVVREFFSGAHTDRQADFVVCKMTLEHVHAPLPFLRAATQVTRRPDGVVFVQVPEAGRIVRECAFEDIYYEHCSYFTAGSLTRLFAHLGFAVLHSEVTYGGQYLTVEAKPSASPLAPVSRDDLDDLARVVASFPQRMAQHVETWGERLRIWRAYGRRVVIWGSGSKGVAFLTTLPGTDVIEHVVDVNPHRHGHFMAGTGQQIVAPRELPHLQPDVVVVMNRVYVPEIERSLRDLGLAPQVLAL